MTSAALQHIVQETSEPQSEKFSHVSFSQVQSFYKCKLKWKLRYIDGIKIEKPTMALVYGTSLHWVIQEYLQTYFLESIQKADSMDLARLLEFKMRADFIDRKEKNGNVSFSSREEMLSYYQSGIEFLEWFKKNKEAYFPKRIYDFVGTELKIEEEIKNNVYIIGYLDLVLKNVEENKIKIIDIKTSERGWNKFDFSDQIKMSQLFIYKKHYSSQYSVPISDFDLEYFIIVRQHDKNKDFSRVQVHELKNSQHAMFNYYKHLENFVDFVFDDDGNFRKDREYEASPSKSNCKFCEYNGTVFCDKWKMIA